MVNILTTVFKSETTESFLVMWELLNAYRGLLKIRDISSALLDGWQMKRVQTGMEQRKYLERTHFAESYHVSSTFSNPKTPIETKFSMILIRKDLPV